MSNGHKAQQLEDISNGNGPPIWVTPMQEHALEELHSFLLHPKLTLQQLARILPVEP